MSTIKFTIDGKEIIAENGIVGAKELEVAVLGKGDAPVASQVGRVMSGEGDEFFNY